MLVVEGPEWRYSVFRFRPQSKWNPVPIKHFVDPTRYPYFTTQLLGGGSSIINMLVYGGPGLRLAFRSQTVQDLQS